jgi:predicted glycosyltransferase involved in capsule biosynthesis
MLDFVYIFNFNPPFLDDAVKRLKCSIKSISSQQVNVCLSNNSTICILDKIKYLAKNIRYVHKPYKGPWSRSLAINFAVKNLVKSNYFFISDIDLVYQHDYVQILSKNICKYKQPVRVINYNYNIIAKGLRGHIDNFLYKRFGKPPVFHEVLYSSSFDYLFNHCNKNFHGFAHGNGLIHLQSFLKIRGFDEEFIGYGPEDDLFNTRIGKINQLIYSDAFNTTTAHLPHPFFARTQVMKNFYFWKKRKKEINSLINPKLSDIMANRNKKNWGVIR